MQIHKIVRYQFQLSEINLRNHKSTKEGKTKQLNVQRCNISAIKNDDVY